MIRHSRLSRNRHNRHSIYEGGSVHRRAVKNADLRTMGMVQRNLSQVLSGEQNTNKPLRLEDFNGNKKAFFEAIQGKCVFFASKILKDNGFIDQTGNISRLKKEVKEEDIVIYKDRNGFDRDGDYRIIFNIPKESIEGYSDKTNDDYVTVAFTFAFKDNDNDGNAGENDSIDVTVAIESDREYIQELPLTDFIDINIRNNNLVQKLKKLNNIIPDVVKGSRGDNTESQNESRGIYMRRSYLDEDRRERVIKGLRSVNKGLRDKGLLDKDYDQLGVTIRRYLEKKSGVKAVDRRGNPNKDKKNILFVILANESTLKEIKEDLRDIGGLSVKTKDPKKQLWVQFEFPNLGKKLIMIQRADDWYDYYCKLAFYSGSPEYTKSVAEYAAEQGYVFGATALRTEDGRKVDIDSEEDIFTTLGLKYIPDWKKRVGTAKRVGSSAPARREPVQLPNRTLVRRNIQNYNVILNKFRISGGAVGLDDEEATVTFRGSQKDLKRINTMTLTVRVSINGLPVERSISNDREEKDFLYRVAAEINSKFKDINFTVEGDGLLLSLPYTL